MRRVTSCVVLATVVACGADEVVSTEGAEDAETTDGSALPDPCGDAETPSVAIGTGRAEEVRPLSLGEAVLLMPANKGGFGPHVVVMTEGLHAGDVHAEFVLRIRGEVVGTHTACGPSYLVCHEGHGRMFGEVPPLDPARFGPEELVDLQGEWLEIEVTLTQDDGAVVTGSAIGTIAWGTE